MFGLDLAYLQSHHEQLVQAFAQNPLPFAMGFFTLYVVVTAASLPVATLLTLLAGAVFGLWPAVIVVSFASSLGATLAMLVARYLFADKVRRRFGSRMEAIQGGIDKDGALYVFALRLTPAVPFFVVNVLMGLTHIRTLTFYAVSQLGMLPLTVLYVNAGTQLATVRSLADVVSPTLLGSLALAGLAPLVFKKMIEWVASRRVRARVYRPWRAVRPQTFDRNLIVIGAGAGGLVSAYIAAAVKAKVTLIEAHKMGGDCLNYGCVPSKALIKSAKLAHQMRHASRYGLSDQAPYFRFQAVMQRVQQVIADIAPHDSVERYTELGVEVLQGYAKLVNPWTVEVALASGGVQQLTARAIVLATGASPSLPPFLQPQLLARSLSSEAVARVVTSDTLWERLGRLDSMPRRIVVLGGGPIGCELAQALQRLGAEVTLVEMSDRLLGREDADVSDAARAALVRDGVRVLTSHVALEVVEQSTAANTTTGATSLLAAHDGVPLQLDFDLLLCAVGRMARLTGYGLEAMGIPVHKTIETNDYLQTIYPHIYAVGDAAGPFQLTHAAAHQAWYAVVNALFGDFKRFKANYRVMPAATFIDPEVARVGLNETEAKAQGVAYEVTRFELDDLDRAIADGQTEGFIKVLTVPGKDKILGVTIVGAHAAELLAEYVLAMTHGLGLNKILGTVHAYPTFAEANKYAAGQWKRAHQPKTLLALVRRFHDWRRG